MTRQGGKTSLAIISMILALILYIYVLLIRVVYGFDIRLHGICEVAPYMEAATVCCGISLISSVR